MFRFRQKLEKSEREPRYRESSPKVLSYSDISKKRESHDKTKSTSKRKLKAPRFLGFRWLILIAGLFIIGWLSVASSQPIVRIAETEVPINTLDSYTEASAKIIRSNIFNHTKVSFDYLGFERDMMTQFPEISSVSTSFALIGDKPVVRLSFHKPAILVTSLGRTWIVDDRGVAIAKYTDKMSNLPKLIDEIGVTVEAGQSVISSKDVEFVLDLHKVATEKGIIIDKFTTPQIPKQINVSVAGEGYYTKFNLNEDSAGQIGTWLVSREQLKSLNQTPSEYIDVRATEKVYWK